ncbi:hypothetical protein [Pedobacter sp. MW01-1-1]|uniref:hypothetical protein n=1 Tax=Pedobacter sp. MW01-1-1 TaxID=3383027 RepID=UPI003FEDD862
MSLKVGSIITVCVMFFMITLGYSESSKAQSNNPMLNDLNEAIAVKIIYNKSHLQRESCKLESFSVNDFPVKIVPRIALINTLVPHPAFELIETDTLIVIQADAKGFEDLFFEKNDDLKYDDNYYLEAIKINEQEDKVSVFTHIYRKVRVFFVECKESRFVIVD